MSRSGSRRHRRDRKSARGRPLTRSRARSARCVRHEATLLAEATGLSRYDALVDRFEPGMTSAVIEPMFADVKRWLPPLIQDVLARQRTEKVVLPAGPFPIAAQRALGLEIASR